MKWPLILALAACAAPRPVLLVIGADWCAACRVVANGALRDPRVAGRFKIVHVDVTDDDRLAQRYHVEALPTFIFLGPDGAEARRLVGTVDADELLASR
jgi:thiol:disulfide interchange protein